MPETRTYQGASLEELLPQIRADLGAGAVITRRREGVTGGFAGFFGKRCVEIEAQAGGPIPAIPARTVFDAYDSSVRRADPDDDGGPVMRSLMEQASPFADALDEALAHDDDVVESRQSEFEDLDLVSANGTVEVAARHVLPAGWDEVAAALVSAGMPEAVVDGLVTDAAKMLAPFDPDASPTELVRRMLARTMRVEHGWRTKSRTIVLVGPRGVGQDPDRGQARARLRRPLPVHGAHAEPRARRGRRPPGRPDRWPRPGAPQRRHARRREGGGARTRPATA